MAERRISELTVATDVAANDMFAVVDTSTATTKQVTRQVLQENLSLTASQVTDFEAAVTANASVTANTAKISFDTTSSTRLANTSGTNTGDQSLPTRDSLGLDTTDTVTFANLSGSNTGDQDLSGKQDNIILTTSGSSGAATLTGATLNIPQYTGGASNLSELSDVDVSVATPSDGDILVYRSAGTDWILEAKPVSSGSPAWGDITGTLSAQTDLNTALGTKLESSDIANFETTTQLNARDSANRDRVNHTGTQAISTITNLQTELDGKAATSHTHTAIQITDFDTEVANNSAVVANTAKVTNATHTGDVTGATALTIANNAVTTAKIINDAVTNAKLANIATATIKGRVTAGTGDPEDLSAAQVRTLLNIADGSTANPNAIDNVVEDTTPQLGGNLDLNEKGFTKQITLGETVTAGQIVHLHTDGKYYLAEADVPADAVDELVLALAGGVLDDIVDGLVFGYYTTSGLTAGSIYYLSETEGVITTTAPTTSLSVVRIVGYALSTTVLLFRPDTGYVELA